MAPNGRRSTDRTALLPAAFWLGEWSAANRRLRPTAHGGDRRLILCAGGASSISHRAVSGVCWRNCCIMPPPSPPTWVPLVEICHFLASRPRVGSRRRTPQPKAPVRTADPGRFRQAPAGVDAAAGFVAFSSRASNGYVGGGADTKSCQAAHQPLVPLSGRCRNAAICRLASLGFQRSRLWARARSAWAEDGRSAGPQRASHRLPAETASSRPESQLAASTLDRWIPRLRGVVSGSPIRDFSNTASKLRARRDNRPHEMMTPSANILATWPRPRGKRSRAPAASTSAVLHGRVGLHRSHVQLAVRAGP